MDNLLKSRISKGEKAYYAAEYILPLLKTYEKEILCYRYLQEFPNPLTESAMMGY